MRTSRRAAVSIAIRNSQKYLRQARGSADETQDELETLARRGFITPEFEDLLAKNRTLCRKLSRFIETVEPRKNHRKAAD